jgi:hypothetical protein
MKDRAIKCSCGQEYVWKAQGPPRCPSCGALLYGGSASHISSALDRVMRDVKLKAELYRRGLHLREKRRNT